jgi:hypothetical protein
LAAEMSRYRHDHGIGAQPESLGSRHGRAYSEGTSPVARGGHHTPSGCRATDNKQVALARPFRIGQSGDLNEKGIAVDK